MKQCISKVIGLITYLWQTLKEYVCKKKILRISDVDNDGKPEIIIDLNGCSDKINSHPNSKRRKKYDRKSDSLLESSRDNEN